MPSGFETPILFLLFNRPDTTELVFEQIKSIRPTQLFFAADGPRPFVAGEAAKCDKAREVIAKVDWRCEVKTLLRDENLGCGLAVSSAITWFFTQVPEGIILEDDCLPEASFFPYCQELLAKFRNEGRVKLIGGINFQEGRTRGKGSYYFTHYPEIWGWATWQRAWREYDFEMGDWNDTIVAEMLQRKFKTSKEKNFWFKKFQATKRGRIDTWDYQLMYAILKNDGIAVSPQVSLVKNIGLTNEPTHHFLHDFKLRLRTQALPLPLVHPEPIVVDKAADYYTFSQIYSRSFPRLLRLVKENGLKKIGLYLWRKAFGKSFLF